MLACLFAMSCTNNNDDKKESPPTKPPIVEKVSCDDLKDNCWTDALKAYFKCLNPTQPFKGRFNTQTSCAFGNGQIVFEKSPFLDNNLGPMPFANIAGRMNNAFCGRLIFSGSKITLMTGVHTYVREESNSAIAVNCDQTKAFEVVKGEDGASCANVPNLILFKGYGQNWITVTLKDEKQNYFVCE